MNSGEIDLTFIAETHFLLVSITLGKWKAHNRLLSFWGSGWEWQG